MSSRGQSIFPKPITIEAAVRTPIGKFGGALAKTPASELAAQCLRALVKRVGPDRKAQTVFLGHARQAGAGPNPARQAVIKAGLSIETPAITLNQACASSLAAVISAAEKIALGKIHRAFAGGVESMSMTPFLLPGARFGFKMGHQKLLDGMHQDGFFCPMAEMLMGETVDVFLARDLKISRQEQDAYALQSQERAAQFARSASQEIEPVTTADGALATDEHPRPDTTLASLAKLSPVFSKEGTVTAGNSSGITDGAAFLSLSDSPSGAIAELLDYEVIALDPRQMGLGPVGATRALLRRQDLTVDAIESFELNEAFAAQVLACNRELKIPNEKLNPHGGAIALGHPIGATGARILVTLLNTLREKPGALGVATLCVSGGQGVAILVRRL